MHIRLYKNTRYHRNNFLDFDENGFFVENFNEQKYEELGANWELTIWVSLQFDIFLYTRGYNTEVVLSRIRLLPILQWISINDHDQG